MTAGTRVGRRRQATGVLQEAAGRRRRDYGKGLTGRGEAQGRADAGRREANGEGLSPAWEGDRDDDGEGFRRDSAGAAEQLQQQRIVEDEEVLAVSRSTSG